MSIKSYFFDRGSIGSGSDLKSTNDSSVGKFEGKANALSSEAKADLRATYGEAAQQDQPCVQPTDGNARVRDSCGIECGYPLPRGLPSTAIHVLSPQGNRGQCRDVPLTTVPVHANLRHTY